MDELLREYADLFPGAYWHLGGDEYQALVRKNPEASFPQLAALARQKYGPKARVQDLATAWVNDRAAVLRPLGRKLKAWNDGFFRGGVVSADKDLEVEYWTGKEIGARVPQEYLREGRRLINVNDEYMYYVLGQPKSSATPQAVGYTRSGPLRDPWHPGGVGALLGPDPGRAVRRLVRPREFPEPGPGGARHRGCRWRATAQKLWDPRTPARRLAGLRGAGGAARPRGLSGWAARAAQYAIAEMERRDRGVGPRGGAGPHRGTPHGRGGPTGRITGGVPWRRMQQSCGVYMCE